MKKASATIVLLTFLVSSLIPSDHDTVQASANQIYSVKTSIYRDRPVEDIVKKFPRTSLNQFNIESLVQKLTEKETDPFIKVKIIHDWVTVNIAYDTKSYFSGNISSTDFNQVLASGKSVCSGYSQLFKKMTELAGFNTVIISGDSKGYGYNPFQRREMNVNHAWNAVEIENKWYLVDTTWDAGHVRGRDFIFDYSTGYLFLDPQYFIFSHYPEDPRWQLLHSEISYSEFTLLHPIIGKFYDFFEIAPEDRSILSSEGENQITLTRKKDAMISLSIVNQNGTSLENKAVARTEGNRTTINAALPESGIYLLRLFATTESEQVYLGELRIESTGGSSILYPTKFLTFIENGFSLREPENQYLIKGRNNRVSLYAPGWKEAFIAINNNRIFMDKNSNDVFTVTLDNFTASEATIYGTGESRQSSFDGAITIFAEP